MKNGLDSGGNAILKKDIGLFNQRRPIIGSLDRFSASGGYHADTVAWNAALAAPMVSGTAQLGYIDTLVRALHATAGLWEAIDRLAVVGLNTDASLRDLRQPAKTWSAVNAITFTANRGWDGDGVSMHLAAGEGMTATPNIAVQNSASLFWWANVQNGATGAAMQMGNSGGTLFNCIPTTTTGGSFRLNDATADSTGAFANRTGFFLMTREGASLKKLYRDGTLAANLTTASTAVSGSAPTPLRYGSTYGRDRLMSFGWGAGMNATLEAALRAALSTYKTSIGA